MRVPSRSLFILGRVSNLPTVWSNCLAAWLICGEGKLPGWPALVTVSTAVSLLYLGGMYLNDACDVAFDAVHRPERPIPARHISRRAVILLGVLFLYAGTLTLFCFVPPSEGWLWIIALPVLIVLYDVFHKQSALAPLLVAGCRVLIYPLTAAVSGGWTGDSPLRRQLLWMAAAAMGAWILTLSLLARTESKEGTFRLPALGLLFLPVSLGLFLDGWTCWFPLLLLSLWICRCIVALVRRGSLAGPVVGDLLAGIPLVDFVFAIQAPEVDFLGVIPRPTIGLLFLGCMALASVLRRYVPAT